MLTESYPNINYTIYYKNKEFTGTATCAPEDYNYFSSTTGEIIASSRALIKYLRYVRDNEVKPGYQALKQLYYSMSHSKHFNSKSYEAKMLFRQLRIKEEELEGIKIQIQREQSRIKTLINSLERTKQYIENKKQIIEKGDNPL